jgi:hypothetical protein
MAGTRAVVDLHQPSPAHDLVDGDGFVAVAHGQHRSLAETVGEPLELGARQVP